MAQLALALPWAIPAGMKVAWGSTLALWGTGLAAAGQIQTGRAMAAQAAGSQAMMDYNAALEERRAKEIEARATFEQKRHVKAGARVMGAMRAGMGKAGVIPSVGTPLLIQAKQASELELENLMIGYRGQVGVSRAKSQAVLDKMQAGIYGRRAKTARTAGYMGAGATVLTGFA